MIRLRGLTSVLFGCGVIGSIVACQPAETVFCPDGFIETQNVGYGDSFICCPYGTTGVDGMCVNEETQADSNFVEQDNQIMVAESQVSDKAVEKETVIEVNIPKQEPAPKEGLTGEEYIIDPNDFVYLTAPNGKGSAYCPKNANSLAWNGVKFKCCGKGLKSVSVPSREDSLCCPQESTSARWVGKSGFDYECCPKGTVEVKNEGEGDKYICCEEGQVAKNGKCLTKADAQKEGKVLMDALGSKGKAYCPENANSLAWDGKEFQCCGKGMKATLIPSRNTSICCSQKATDARWVGKKWNDFECCPAGTVETPNVGEGDKYVCCKEGDKAFNGECLSVK